MAPGIAYVSADGELENRAPLLLKLLYLAGTAIQKATDLSHVTDILLTAVTARYGLRFERAAIFLLNRVGSSLEGLASMEQADVRDASGDPDSPSTDLTEFDSYLIRLLNGEIQRRSANDDPVQGLRIPVPPDSLEPFSTVIRGREPSVFDTEKHEVNEEFARLLKPGSFILVPLIAQAEVIGVLFADRGVSNTPINNSSVWLLSAFANQAATAISSLSRKDEDGVSARMLAVTEELGQALTAGFDMQRLLDEVYHQASRFIDTTSFYIALYDEESENVTFALDVVEGKVDRPYEIRQAGQGLTEYIARNRRSVLIPENIPGWLEAHGVELIGRPALSWLGVPLTIGRRVLGVIAVQSYTTPNLYDENDRDLLTAIARQAAVALDNVFLLEETKRRLLREERMNELAHMLGAEVTLATLLPRLLRPVAEMAGADAAAVAVLEPDGETFFYPYLYNLPASLANLRIPKGGGVAGQAMRGGEPVMMDDYRLHPAALPEWVKAGIRSNITAPVLEEDRVVGALGLFTLEEPRPFLRGARATAEAAARLTAVAIQRARLFEEEQAQRALTEALAKAAADVSSTLDLDVVLDRILEQVAQVVPGDGSNVMLLKDGVARVVRWRGYERRQDTLYVISDYAALRQMAQTGKPIIVEDTLEYSGWVLLEGKEWLRAYVAAPIRIGEEIVGFLNVNGRRPGQFSESDARRLEIFASHAATAIGNARAHQDTVERLRRTRALREVMLAAASTLEFDQVLEAAFEALKATVGVELISIALPDGNEDVLWSHPSHLGYRTPGERVRLPMDKSVCGRVFQTGESIRLDDVSKVDFYFEDHPDVRSELAVPVKVGGSVTGVLNVESTCLGAFSEEDQEFYEAIAGQLGVALQNSRSLAETHDMLTQAAALYEASRHLASASTQEEVAAALCEAVGGSVFDRCVVLMRRDHPDYPEGAMVVVDGWTSVARRVSIGSTMDARRFRPQPAVYNKAPHNKDLEKSFRRLLDDWGVDALASLPLVVDDRLVGTVNLEVHHPHAIVEQDLLPFEALAEQAATALENIELTAETEYQLDVLNRLYEGLGALSTLSQDDVLNSITGSLQAIFGLATCTVGLIDDELGELRIVAGKGIPDLPNYPLERVPKDLLKQVQEGTEPIPIPDLSSRPDLQALLLRKDLQSFLIVPLRGREGPLGLITMGSTESIPLAPRHFDLLKAFSSQAAIAIENAELYEETERRMLALERLEEVGQTLGTATEMRDVLQKIVKNAVVVLGAAGAVIYSYDSSTGEFDLDEVVSEGLGDRRLLISKAKPRKGGTTAATMAARFLVVDDVDAPEYIKVIGGTTRRTLDRVGIRAFVGVSLWAGEEPVGLLYINFKERHSPSEQERSTIEAYAGQAAVAIQRARLFRTLEQELERRSDEQDLTDTVAQLISTVPTPRRIWKEILLGALAITEAKRGMVYLLDGEKRRLVAEVSRGVAKSRLPPLEIDSERPGIVGWAARNRQTALVSDVRDEEWSAFYVPTGPGIRSELAVPILDAGSNELLGVINLESPRRSHFSADDQKLVERLAVYAGMAVSNAEVYRNTRSHLRQLDALFRAVRDIARLRPLDEILQPIVKALHGVFRFDSVILYLYDSKNKSFSQPVIAGSVSTVPAKGTPPEKNVLWSVLEAREDYFADEAATHPVLGGPFVEREGISSSGCVRLRVGREVVGLLFVNSKEPRQFSDGEKRVVQSFANQAAVAIHNARQYEETEQRLRRQAAVLEATQATATLVDLNQVLQAITDAALEALDFDVIKLHLYDEATGTFSSPAMSGELFDEAAVRVGPATSESAVARVMRHGKSCFVEDVNAEPLLRGDFTRREQIASAAALLLRVEREPVGVIFFNSREPRSFSSEDEEALRIIANQAAIAVYNARLYDRARRELNESEGLRRICVSVAGTLDTHEVLDSVMQAAIQLTNADEGSILLYDAHQDAFTRALASSGRGQPLQVYESTVRRRGGLAAAVIEHGKPVVIEDTRKDPRVNPVAIKKGRLAVAGIPLPGLAGPIGVLWVDWKEPRRFSGREVDLLTALASQAAVSLENAQLYDGIRSQVEELTRARQRADASIAAAWVGMVSSAWTHTVRSDASTIRRNLETARRLIASDADIAKTLATIKQADDVARRMQDMIDPRVYSWEEVELVNVHAVLSEVASRMTSNREVPVVWRSEDDTGIMVRASRRWLVWTFEQIVDNAIWAMEGRRAAEVNVSARLSDETLEIRIADKGKGISDRILPHLFQRRITADEGAQGSGTGLLLAWIALQQFGGDIKIEHTGVQGTTMLVTLPLAEWEPEAVAPTLPREAPVSVLLISGDESWSRVVRDSLAAAGAGVDVAPDLVRGLERAQSGGDTGPYSLIVLDVSEYGEASESVERLLSVEPDAKVVVASAAPHWRSVGRWFHEGAVDYIEKTLDSDSELDRLASLLPGMEQGEREA